MKTIFRGHASPFASSGLLLGLCLAFAFPFLWMLFASFKSDADIFNPFPLWPEHFEMGHYHSLLSGEWIPYGRQFLNSLLIAGGQTLLATAFACCAGYVFAKFEFPLKKTLLILAVLTVLIPRQALILPLFMWMNALSLLDTPWAVILPGAASGVGVLWFTAVFRRLPDSLLDMARCEGAGEYRVFWTALPLVKPALIAFALIQFVLCWQEHLLPLVMLSSAGKLTATIGLSSLNAGNFRLPYGILMAGCVLTVIPTALLFAITRRHFRSSLDRLTEA